LVKVLEHGDPWAKKCAVIALGRIGPEARRTLPQLWPLFQTEDDYTKADIARTAWRLDPASIDTTLPWLRSHVTEQLKASESGEGVGYALLSALDLLGEMGPAALPALPDILLGLSSREPSIAFSSAWAACRIAPDEHAEALNVLRRIDQTPDPKVSRNEKAVYFARIGAAGALWQVEPDRRAEIQQRITELLKDWSYQGSYESIPATDETLIPALRAILDDPAEREIHPMANDALVAVSGERAERW
jgi:hypothetical protein